MSSDRLSVIALISGGKDSFFSLLHCINRGHRVIALANLYPASSSNDEFQVVQPGDLLAGQRGYGAEGEETDLNSFMYQTVGHEVIPLYAAATGLPLYRQPIHGSAVYHERDYDYQEGDETESMYTLLSSIKHRHPEANAVSAGAILSTYQRTRVESVALRLGLTPLAFLWKYPVLPPPSDSPKDDAQLLLDMAVAGLEARIIKVASAGLSENDLWERVTDSRGAEKVKRALRKFGAVGGAVLGEGGEFETIVVDGPQELFRKTITVPENAKKVVNEGGGTTWLLLKAAQVEEKPPREDAAGFVRTPEQWDPGFKAILDDILGQPDAHEDSTEHGVKGAVSTILGKSPVWHGRTSNRLQWSVMPDGLRGDQTIEEETVQVVEKIKALLARSSLEPSQISNTVVILRQMSDFPKVNTEYGKLFTKANPPSRVTISCGDLLPEGINIGIFLTVDSAPLTQTARRGLHVQSRSYWAPANIGPYSQAIGIPMSTQEIASDAITWSVAGQIPLIPGTMILPNPSNTSHAVQIALSLQHLWRIGTDLTIQYWTSAVAYFARANQPDEMERNAQMAGRAWRLAHVLPEEDEDEEGPDPWDLKYNPAFMALAGNAQHGNNKPLPDRSVLTLRQQNEPQTCIPPLFAVEVQELPRQSAVEWHTHLGVSQLSENSVELFYSDIGDSREWRVWHFVARESGVAMVHTLLAQAVVVSDIAQVVIMDEMASIYHDSLAALGIVSPQPSIPYLQYLDTTKTKFPKLSSQKDPPAIIPCYSIWSATGDRFVSLGLYRTEIRI